MTLWSNGRFSWPFVVAVAVICLSLIGADLIWRLFPVFLGSVIATVVVVDAAFLILLVLVVRRLARGGNIGTRELGR